jgi:hypothetical protein
MKLERNKEHKKGTKRKFGESKKEENIKEII